MSRHKRIPSMTALVVAIAVLAGASFMTATGLAKSSTRHVSITVHAKTKGTSISGTISGTLGSGTQVGKSTSTTGVDLVWHLKGGTIHVVANGKLAGGTRTAGTWKIVGGTGKFKGIKGGGTQDGNVETLTFKYSGTVTG